MVKITLTNQNAQSPYKKAILNIALCTCIIDDQLESNFEQLQKLNFQHPLLVHPYLDSTTNLYHYSYDDLDGLLKTAKYIYATLLHANNPQECRFIISPSPKFLSLKTIYKIPFSLDYYKAAKQFITVSQMNGLISQSSNYQFNFLDKLIIDDKLSFENFPSDVDGDILFSYETEGYEQLNKIDPFEKCELRNINQFIGFGVYAREDIQLDEPVCLYLGVKCTNPEIKRYYFNPRLDTLGLGTDARYYSNIGRFVNHAPSPSRAKDSDVTLLKANLATKRYVLYGIEVVGFTALRAIAKGEQLLADYGATYFESDDEYRFNIDGQLKDPQGRELIEKYHEKLAMLRIMARNGINQAAYRLLKRPMIALVLAIIGFLLIYSIF